MRRFLLLLLLASASAFVLPLAARPRVGFTRVRMGVEQAAKNCLEEGCPIDLVEVPFCSHLGMIRRAELLAPASPGTCRRHEDPRGRFGAPKSC